MARIRYLKPDFTDDVDLAEVSITARYLYANLWCHMDRDGVCDADPKLIKRWIFPYDDDHTSAKVSSLIDELVEHGFLFRVEHNGRNFLYCPTLKKHQLFHKYEKSKRMVPQEKLSALYKHGASTVLEQCKHRNAVPHSPLPVTSYQYAKTEIPKKPEEGGLHEDLAGMEVGAELLATIPVRSQAAWVRVFGKELVRNTWPLIYQAWETDDERRSQGGFAQYARRFLENQRHKADTGPPKKKKLRVVKGEIPWE